MVLFNSLRCLMGLHVPAPRVNPHQSKFWCCSRCGERRAGDLHHA